MIRENQHDILPAHAKIAIYSDCHLSRYAELAYLSHFVECYRPSLQLACLQHYPMYILEDRQQRLGISFFGSGPTERAGSARVSTEISTLHERWLVLAPGNVGDHKHDLSSFISSYIPGSGFDVIFLFDYFQSNIQIIK